MKVVEQNKTIIEISPNTFIHRTRIIDNGSKMYCFLICLKTNGNGYVSKMRKNVEWFRDKIDLDNDGDLHLYLVPKDGPYKPIDSSFIGKMKYETS